MIENIFLTIFSSIFLVSIQIGEIAFFVVVAILGIAVIVKVVKNKKKVKK